MDQIEAFLRTQVGLSDETLLCHAARAAFVHTLQKGECLIEIGERPSALYFLLDGIVRGYFLDGDGREITDCFGCQFGMPAMPYADFTLPSNVNIVAMEDCRFLAIPMEFVQDLLHTNLEIANIYNRMLLEGVAQHWELKTVLYRFPAAQRVEWFLTRYEGLIDRVPHSCIASFLGMSPVHFSRLRHNDDKK